MTALRRSLVIGLVGWSLLVAPHPSLSGAVAAGATNVETKAAVVPATSAMQEPGLVIGNRFSLEGRADDLGWAGGCLLATRQYELYRYDIERRQGTPEWLPRTTVRDYVGFISGPDNFGIAIEGNRHLLPIDSGRRSRLQEALVLVRCAPDGSLVEIGSVTGVRDRYAIGGALSNRWAFFVEAGLDSGPPYGGDYGCCLGPTLVAVDVLDPAAPIITDRVYLGSNPTRRDGDNYWTPQITFATDGTTIAVGGNNMGSNIDRQPGRQIVVAQISADGKLAIVGRTTDHGDARMAVHNGDLYVAASPGVRRFTFAPGGDVSVVEAAATGSIQEVVSWGERVVAMVERVTVDTGERDIGLYEVVAISEPAGLELRHMADFRWRGHPRAESRGALLAIHSVKLAFNVEALAYEMVGEEGVTVLQLALPEAIHLPMLSHAE